MLREKSIENCKSFKKSCKNKNYDITVIDKSSDKIRQESETTLKRTKKLLSMIKGNKYSDQQDKTLRNYKDKDKIGGNIGILSTFLNETKIDVETAPDLNGEYVRISTFKLKKKKNTEEHKIKGIISKLSETKKKILGWQK